RSRRELADAVAARSAAHRLRAMARFPPRTLGEGLPSTVCGWRPTYPPNLRPAIAFQPGAMNHFGRVLRRKSRRVRAWLASCPFHVVCPCRSLCPLPVGVARVKFPVLNCRTEAGVRHFDVAAMFASLWLLTSMVIDAVTPRELSVYMIGAAIAP